MKADEMSCKDCEFFKRYETAKVVKSKTEPPFPIVILEGLPRNSDGSINYEDIVFADNARKALGGER